MVFVFIVGVLTNNNFFNFGNRQKKKCSSVCQTYGKRPEHIC